MGRIRILDDHLINRIAAGEVVERPSSVVKELLENGLDAGAKAIDVQVVAGGKGSIRVRDDGCGMDRDDALLALERHATSKVSRYDDLKAIKTLGFRGEALPSIAAVSRFLLRTAMRDGEGTEVEVRAGKIIAVRVVGSPRGTWIEVGSLFMNVPARRKFLRSDATELSHVVRLVTHYAMTRPGVHFRLDHDGRRLLDAPRVNQREERVAQIYGSEFSAKLLPFALERQGVSVSGFAGRPVDALPRRDAQHLFINGRLVQDRVLSHAIAQAYGDTMPRGRYPAILLFLELEPARMDVNVHPQKTEVRFAQSSEVHDIVREALISSLAHKAAVPTLSDLRRTTRAAAPSSVAGAAIQYLDLREGATLSPDECRSSLQGPRMPSVLTRREDVAACPPLPEAEGPSRPSPTPDVHDAPDTWVVPLAQFRDSFIVAEDARGLVVVDQHVAHERVLYERYLAAAEENRVEVQRLLLPRFLELAPHEQPLLEEEAEEFLRLGFLLEPFGPGTFRLDGVPAMASNMDPTFLVRELLGEAMRASSVTSGVGELRRTLVTTTACHAAIKVNHPLTFETMKGLLRDLFRTSNPTTCPHGRPILFRLSLEELERAFRRR